MGIARRLREFFNPPETAAQATIINRTRRCVLASAASVADTPASRKRGLLKHHSLDPGQGLWIVPSGAVHCFGMKFDIDVVFLDRRYRVKKIRPRLKPGRIALCLSAHSVLELPAGTLANSGTCCGDEFDIRLSVVETSPK